MIKIYNDSAPAARRALAGLAIALLVAPALAGTAGAFRARDAEPDTPQDRSGFYMWPDDSYYQHPWADRIYFDVVPSVGGAVGPSLAASSSLGAVASPDLVSFQALLGVWKDCNRDGYIGDGATGLMVYPSVLLLDNELCPFHGYGGHNVDGYVTEFLWIGPSGCEYDASGAPVDCPCPGAGSGCEDLIDFERFHDDQRNPCSEWGCFGPSKGRVWADFGLPHDAAHPAPGSLALDADGAELTVGATGLKTRPDVSFEFTPPRKVPDAAGLLYGSGTPLDPTQAATEVGWASVEQFVGWPTLAEGSGATHVTGYADILDRWAFYDGLPTWWGGIYGAGACYGPWGSGITGWNCDPDAWLAGDSDAVAVFDYYDTRDVDCYTGIVKSANGLLVGDAPSVGGAIGRC